MMMEHSTVKVLLNQNILTMSQLLLTVHLVEVLDIFTKLNTIMMI